MKYQEGLHGAQITDQELTTTKNGHAAVLLTIQILTKVVETQDPGTGEPVRVFENVELSEKRKIWLVVNDNCAEWTAERLAKLGFLAQPSQIKDKESAETNLIGTEHLFEMKLGGDDGTRENWNVPTDSRGGRVAEPTTDVQDLALDAAYGAIFRDVQAKAAGTEAPKEQVQQITAASADVPF